jgi:hypothetical protein
MTIEEHYHRLKELLDGTLKTIFKGLKYWSRCSLSGSCWLCMGLGRNRQGRSSVRYATILFFSDRPFMSMMRAHPVPEPPLASPPSHPLRVHRRSYYNPHYMWIFAHRHCLSRHAVIP